MTEDTGSALLEWYLPQGMEAVSGASAPVCANLRVFRPFPVLHVRQGIQPEQQELDSPEKRRIDSNCDVCSYLFSSQRESLALKELEGVSERLPIHGLFIRL
ncbi:MAG: hypothetical protein RBT67_03225 [Thauera sp.]|jgi:hypothetical protein|nr:hypothetical protein [Thauera sp.]